MLRSLLLLALFVLPVSSALAADAAHPLFHHSGQPIPRFVSFKSAEVNVRVGPGKRYPISWVYRRALWPVEVIEEFGHWRRVRDWDGDSGWVHKSLLGSARSAIITERKRSLYTAPDASAPVAFEAEAHTHGQILRCTPRWCELEMQGHRGWIRRDYVWGLYEDEVIEE